MFMWSQFLCAITFLTIIRLPSAQPETVTSQDLARSFSFFPIVGLIIGAHSLLLAYIFAPWMPPLLLAVSLTATTTILTRALHLDGLADLIDGVGGGYTPHRRLEIMKDSRTGAFGAIALFLALFFKSAAFYTLILHARWAPLLLVPALSRYAMILAAYGSPYARAEGGLGKPFLEHMTAHELIIASGLAIAITLSLARLYTPLYLASLLLIVAILRRSTRHWLGGITGDVLGAVNELSEVALLSLAACLP
jgi:adenosylcobinamide-GDP ribazoletransferase